MTKQKNASFFYLHTILAHILPRFSIPLTIFVETPFLNWRYPKGCKQKLESLTWTVSHQHYTFFLFSFLHTLRALWEQKYNLPLWEGAEIRENPGKSGRVGNSAWSLASTKHWTFSKEKRGFPLDFFFFLENHRVTAIEKFREIFFSLLLCYCNCWLVLKLFLHYGGREGWCWLQIEDVLISYLETE